MRIRKLQLFLVTAVVLLLVSATAVSAATPAEIENSIVKGLAWLDTQQNADGSWNPSYKVAYTGFVVLKMEDRATELGYDPFDPNYEYSDELKAGLNYLFKRLQADGSFDTDSHKNYQTGIALMAIANSGHPNDVVTGTGNANADGKTYLQIAQMACNYLNSGQMGQGGWGYSKTTGPEDNSNSGYVVLGLTYAQQKFGIPIPGATTTGLTNWINVIQINGGADDGSSMYRTNWLWPNVLKTGNLLYEQKMVGLGTGDTKVQRAKAYIEKRWNDANTDPGWGKTGSGKNYQAMYTMMKGFEAQGITSLTVGGNPVDWYDEVATRIVTTQDAAGYWDGGGTYGDRIGDTAWALLTLEKSVSPPPADFDVIKSVDKQVIDAGETVKYTYLIVNTRNTPITGIVLADDKLGVIAGPTSGDDNLNGVLDPLETWKYEISETLSATTTNNAVATGKDPTGAPISVTSNSVTVTVRVPSPEFPTLALPAGMILGMTFIVYSIRKRV